jgi:HAMP domain-containing protein
MRPLPIRVRLTAWYFGVLAAAFALFGAVAFFAMRQSIQATVDESLRDRAAGIQALMEQILPEGPERLEDELREHSELREEGDLSQVCDQGGHWIYRSQLMKRYDVPVLETPNHKLYNFERQGVPLRVLATTVYFASRAYGVQVAAPMDDFNDALNHFRSVLLLLTPLLLLVASAGGYWMSRRALAPVDEITQAAQRISSRNLSSRLAVPQSRDELQQLSETLNGMLERLEAAF